MNRSFYSYSLTTLIVLLVASVTVTAIFAVMFVRHQATNVARSQLVNAHETTLALLAGRLDLLEEAASGLSRDPELRKALIGSKNDQLAALLKTHRAPGADGKLIVITANGKVRAHTGWAGALDAIDANAAFATDRVTPLLINGVPYHTGFAAIDLAGERLWVGVAEPFNQGFLGQVSGLTNVDVALETGVAGGSESQRIAAEKKVEKISRSFPLGAAGPDPSLRYSVSRDDALGGARDFAFKLAALAFALVAVMALLATLVMNTIVGRLVFKPLGALHDALSLVRQGVYAQELVINGGDVVGRLADAFNQMQAEVAERESRIVHHAEYDALTGLTNRAVVADRLGVMLARARRDGTNVAALTVDIKRFSDINGTLGTEIGDEVLKEVARRLASNTRATDLLARVGGDEFLIVVADTEDRLTAHIAEFLAETLERPINASGRKITLRVRIGAALFPDHCESPEGLRRLANVALTTAKETGQRVVKYEPGQDEKHLRELAVLNDLNKSISEGHLSLHYQPKIEMKTRIVEHVEALVRWHHPQLGFIPPDEFIELLERHNRIHILTDWVLKTAVEQAQRWASRGYDLRIAINISAHDLLDVGLSQRIDTLLHHYAVEPNRITVEVTESAVMQDAELASRVLHTLREAGIKVAVDDFGTGQTSLSLLKKLPLNELKIDKSFVQDLRADSGDGIIIKSTIDLGHNMGLLVVAEGVETNYAWNLLKSYGCDSVQGYLISKPLPADQLEVWFLRLQARQVSRLDLSFVDEKTAEETKKAPKEADLLAEILGDTRL